MNKNKISIVKKGLEYIGIMGIVGKEHNQTIVNFFKKIGFNNINDDETPWCTAFINNIMHDLELPKSNTLMARSWLKMGVPTLKPEMGDITILWRGSKESIFGHVGVYIASDEKNVYLLGGNQNNGVNISKYPKDRVIGHRSLFID